MAVSLKEIGVVDSTEQGKADQELRMDESIITVSHKLTD
jgi:hypothetical protein